MVKHCQNREQRDELLEEAIGAILSTLDIKVVLVRTAGILRKYFGATRAGINIIKEGNEGFVETLLVSDPEFPTPAPGTLLPVAGSVCEEAISKKAPVKLDRLSKDEPIYHEEKELAEYGYESLVCFPLILEGRVIGTLQIAHMPREGLGHDCQSSAGQLANLLAIAVHNSMMVDEVRRLNSVLSRENTILRGQIKQARQGWRYIAESPLMREVMERVRLVAPTDTSVIIRGETGTGKEGIARTIHELSRRSGGPLVVVNLGAIPDNLIESELFGHEKGAFTGAVKRRQGRFEQAAGGTIFLDEIGDAPLPVQVKLLRALQEKEVQRVGGEGTLKVDVRVIAATNRPLERMLEEGTFRPDLYYRLNIFPIVIPPLSERREDIAPLARYFVERHATAMNRKPPEMPAEVVRQLERRQWPGNVRELENHLERALLMTRGTTLVLPGDQEAPRSDDSPEVTGGAIVPFDLAVRDLLGRALAQADGRIHGPDGAAALLAIKPTTLQGKLKKYGIGRPKRLP